MMKSLEHYIMEVEADKSSQFINNVSSNPSKDAVTANTLANWQRDIDADENGFKGGNNVGNEIQRNKSKKLLKQRIRKKQTDFQQQQQRQQAQLRGYEQAGRDAYNDYMNKVEKKVASMADKQTSKLIQQRNAIRMMANRKNELNLQKTNPFSGSA